MSIEVRSAGQLFIPAQQREIALCYASLPRGSKAAYARSLELSAYTIRKWISALADGDLDTGRFPRKTGAMTNKDIFEVTRLKKLLKKQQAQATAREAELAEQLQEKDREIATLEKVADALGKAMTVLHDLGAPPDKEGQN